MNLSRLLEEGRFVVTGELVPPRSPDPGVVRRAAQRLRGLVDAVNVTDNATARVGMTPLAAAMLAAGEGLDPVLQLTCRDRNRLALTADLLGAHALGIRAVLCLSGDPMEVGRTGAKPVFDLDAVGLARLATDLGQGRAPGGTTIDPPARFLVGVAEAPGADPSGGDRLAAKADAGATFAQTQPIYDVAQFAAWLDRLAARGLPDRVAILAGILPPTSAAQLERFATLPGWSVPDAVLARMRAARDQRAEGIALAAEMVQAVRTLPGVRGIHLMGLGHLRRPRGRPRRRPPAPPGPGLSPGAYSRPSTTVTFSMPRHLASAVTITSASRRRPVATITASGSLSRRAARSSAASLAMSSVRSMIRTCVAKRSTTSTALPPTRSGPTRISAYVSAEMASTWRSRAARTVWLAASWMASSRLSTPITIELSSSAIPIRRGGLRGSPAGRRRRQGPRTAR